MEPYIFEFILQFFKYLLIFSGLYILLRYFLDRTSKPATHAQENSGSQDLSTLRLQAYERFVLFLERNDPSSLVLRLNSPGLSAWQLQSLMVKSIREEFDYNLSQQLYISSKLWNLIKNAKEESITLINQALAELPAEAMSEDLVHLIYTKVMTENTMANEIALTELKKEAELRFPGK